MDNRGSFAKVFRALGDAHRLQILELLMEQDRNAGELLQEVQVVQSTLSHHMKALVESELVTGKRDGKWMLYSLNREKAEEAKVYLEHLLTGERMEPANVVTEEAAGQTAPIEEVAPAENSSAPEAEEAVEDTFAVSEEETTKDGKKKKEKDKKGKGKEKDKDKTKKKKKK